MKKLLLTAILLVPNIAMGDNNTVYKWSASALADTIKEVRNSCETTGKDDFKSITNWIKRKEFKFSVTEIMNFCGSTPLGKTGRVTQQKSNNKCTVPNDGKQYEIRKGQLGCNALVSTYFHKNNQLSYLLKDVAEDQPGVYVQILNCTTGKPCYPIIDVIGITEQLDPRLVNIYGYNGKDFVKVADAWTEDMFIDIRNDDTREGQFFGAVPSGSYVFPNHEGYDYTEAVMKRYAEAIRRFYFSYDVGDMTEILGLNGATVHDTTKGVTQAFDNLMGTNLTGGMSNQINRVLGWIFEGETPPFLASKDWKAFNILKNYVPKQRIKYPDGTVRVANIRNVVQNLWDSFDNQYFDIKTLARGVVGQESAALKVNNGVVFAGKIANFDWLGHFLFGMNWALVGLGPLTDAAHNAELLTKGNQYESAKQVKAYEMGVNFVSQHFGSNLEKINFTYANKGFSSKENAIASICGSRKGVSSTCGTNAGGDDIVICYTADGSSFEMFVVDDICDKGKAIWEAIF